jgi:FtsH-binding integral membrane protein
MHWQDFVFTIGSLFFIVALVYSVRNEDKPPTKTSVITGFWLGVFSVVYATLGLPLAAITSAISAILWGILAAQTINRDFCADCGHVKCKCPVFYSNAGSVG